MNKIDFKALAEPFPKNEVKTLTKTWKDKKTGAEKRFSAPYLTARHVMNRLDKVVGPENWRDEYEFLPGGRVMCTLYLRVNGEWIGKADMGTETDVEPEKGAVSDAFKRAAVRWGIGRELYNDGTAFDDDDPPARPAPNPRRIPDAAPPPSAPEPSELDAHLGPRKPRGKGAARPEPDTPAHTDELPPAAQDDGADWRTSTAPLTQATWAKFQPWLQSAYGMKAIAHVGNAVMQALREAGKVPPGDKPDWGAVFGKVTPGEVLDALDAHYAEPLAKAS